MLISQHTPASAHSSCLRMLQWPRCRAARHHQLSLPRRETCGLPRAADHHSTRFRRQPSVQVSIVVLLSSLIHSLVVDAMSHQLWSHAYRAAVLHRPDVLHQQLSSQKFSLRKKPQSAACAAVTGARCSTFQCAPLSPTAGCTATPASMNSGWRSSRRDGAHVVRTRSFANGPPHAAFLLWRHQPPS